MRVIIVLLCLIVGAFASYRVSNDYVPQGQLPIHYPYGEDDFEQILQQIQAGLMHNPGTSLQPLRRFRDYGGYRFITEVYWYPGDGEDDTVEPPHAEVSPSEFRALRESTSNYLSSHTRATGYVNILQDGQCRGGRLYCFIRAIINPTIPRPPTPPHNKLASGAKVNATIIMVPYGNGKNGTFIDLSKHKDYKIPPKNITMIPMGPVGPSNGIENICKKHDYNPMKMCKVLPGSIIAGTTIAEKNKPDGILLKSSSGMIVKFENFAKLGALCVMQGPDGGGWCWGERKDNKGPYAITLHTNGALCLYNSVGAYACTAGGPKNDGMYRLIMQDDGNLVIYRGPGINQPIWNSGTNYMSKSSGPVDCGTPMKN
jgi:hypothetical protein